MNSSEKQPGGSRLLAVGRIAGPHANRGAVYVEPLSDQPGRFEAGGEMLLEYEDGETRPVKTSRCVYRGKRVIVEFEELDKREEVEPLRGRFLFIREEDAGSLERDEYWEHELIGMEVRSENGRLLGEVREVVYGPHQDRLEVGDTCGGVFYVPFVGALIEEIDTRRRTIVVRALKGLVPER